MTAIVEGIKSTLGDAIGSALNTFFPGSSALASLTPQVVRTNILQVLNFASVVSMAYMIWKGLAVYTNTPSPVVVVLSESMSPAFERGDILFLTMDDSQPIVPGDITVFNIKGRDIPIVHRVLKIHQHADGRIFCLTKGDNNNIHDRGLYNTNQLWLSREDLSGRVKGYVPYLGMITIIMNDYPMIKVAFIVIFGLFVIMSKE